MRLDERLKRADERARKQASERPVDEDVIGGGDPFMKLKNRAQQSLFAKLGPRLYDSSMSESELQDIVARELSAAMALEKAPFSKDEQVALGKQIRDEILGYGPLHMYLEDPAVTEIMVNSEDYIYIERDGIIEQTDTRFASRQSLRRVIDRIVAQVGRRIDESSPMVDARLPDGSRVNAVIPPLAVDGPALTIRVFSKEPFEVDDLIEIGTMNVEVAELLKATVEGKMNMLVTGGTGTGKTTMLNVLSGFIPATERIITIEDAVELQLAQNHIIRLESRPPNVEGKGQISIRELVRNALRMRPDRIVVGEVRGGEALDMLQAMNTGHEGSLSTVHANSPRDAMSRLETMVLMAGIDLPARAIREQVASAVDLIVHLSRMRDGSRRIVQVSEVVGMEGDTITLQDVFAFDYKAGMDSHGRYLGSIQPTGIRPQFTDRLAEYGIHLSPGVFGRPQLQPTNGRRRSR